MFEIVHQHGSADLLRICNLFVRWHIRAVYLTNRRSRLEPQFVSLLLPLREDGTNNRRGHVNKGCCMIYWLSFTGTFSASEKKASHDSRQRCVNKKHKHTVVSFNYTFIYYIWLRSSQDFTDASSTPWSWKFLSPPVVVAFVYFVHLMTSLWINSITTPIKIVILHF